jgi:asparagine synthase (glutamine-hydrolysing)
MHGRTRIPPKPSALAEWSKIGKFINPEFARRIRLEGRVDELQNDAFPANATNREAHWHSISSGLFSYCLESLDKAAAAFAIEPRYPFFDRRLIEFCLALPPGQRIQNGWTRSILRRAMAGILPPEIQWRKNKSDISVGFRLNLLKFERETLERVILHHPEIIQNYVDLSSLQDLYRRYTVQPRKSGLAFNILLAVTLDLWLRRSGLSSATKMQTKEVSYAL